MKGVRKEGGEKGGNLRRKRRTINLTKTYHVSHICLCVWCVCVCVCVVCVVCVCVCVVCVCEGIVAAHLNTVN